MGDRRQLSVGGSGNPILWASVVKTEQETDGHRAREGGAVALPMRTKKEDISEVPLKVPRFKYVDFPSLHQCIQQLTVPPLDNWLGTRSGRPSGPIPVNANEQVPKFKYVDFPSLHHCIKQLSVPPIESWTSGLAKVEREGGERHGLGSIGHSASVKGNYSGQDNAVPVHKQEKYTAFPFPGPDPGTIQCGTTSNQAFNRPQLPVHICSQSQASRVEYALQNKIVGVDSQFKQPAMQISSFSVIKHERGAGPPGETNKMSAVEDKAVIKVHKENTSLQTYIPQTQTEPSDLLSQGEEFWRTIPESVCPFCRKMFSDTEDLRLHQRGHLEKVSLYN